MAEGVMRTIHRVEPGDAPGTARIVNRVFIEFEEALCPNCGNEDPAKFERASSGTVIDGLVCMACTR